jgi:hypothetical protein
MVLIEKHAQEVFWLRRRIDFLEKMNELLDEDEHLYEVKLNAEQIATQYKKVENPEDVIKRLKEIYGRDLK